MGDSQKLPVAQVAGSVFVCWAASASTNAVDVLIAFWGVLCKIDTCSKHPSYVGVTLIKAFVNDGIDKRGACKKLWQDEVTQ